MDTSCTNPVFGDEVLNGLLGSRGNQPDTRERVLEQVTRALQHAGVQRVRYYAIARETAPELSQEESLYLTWASYIDPDNDLLGIHIPLERASINRSIEDLTLDPVIETSARSPHYPWIGPLTLKGRVWVDVLVRQWRRNIGVLAFDWSGDSEELDPSSLATLRLLGQILGFQLSATNPTVARTLRESLASIYGRPSGGDIGLALKALREQCDIASLSLFRYSWSADSLRREMLIAPGVPARSFAEEEYRTGQSLTGLAFADERYRRILHFDSFHELAPQLVNDSSLAFHQENTGPVRSVAYAVVGVEAPLYLIRTVNHGQRPRLRFVEDAELITSFAQSLSPYVDAELADQRTLALGALQRFTAAGAPLAAVVEKAEEMLRDVEGLRRGAVVLQRDGSAHRSETAVEDLTVGSTKPHFIWGCPEAVATEVRDSVERHPLWTELRAGTAASVTVLRRQQSGPFGRLLHATAREDSHVAVLKMRAGDTFGCFVFPVFNDGWGRHRRNALVPPASAAFLEQVAATVVQAAEQAYVAALAKGALQALSFVGHEMTEPHAATVSLTGSALGLAEEAASEANRPDLLRQISNLRVLITDQTATVDGAMRLSLLVGRQMDNSIRGTRKPIHIGSIINAALQQLRSEVRRELLPSPHALRIARPTGDRDAVIVVDGPLVRSALVNLMRNGLKYSSPIDGETRIDVAVVHPKAPGSYLDIEVTNYGPEIPSMEREAIFDAFTRGEHAQGGGSIRGMGLGLYLVRQIAQAHGGNAFVKGQDRIPQADSLFRTTMTLRLRSDLAPGDYPNRRQGDTRY